MIKIKCFSISVVFFLNEAKISHYKIFFCLHLLSSPHRRGLCKLFYKHVLKLHDFEGVISFIFIDKIHRNHTFDVGVSCV
jgi:hypothetical protein